MVGDDSIPRRDDAGQAGAAAPEFESAANAPHPGSPDAPSSVLHEVKDGEAQSVLQRVPGLIKDFLPLAIALISLAISLYNFAAANAQPEVWLFMPGFIRMSFSGSPGGATVLYLQPTFVNAGRNQRSEVVRDLALRLDAVQGNDHADFHWLQQGTFSYNPNADLQYTWVVNADAGPLMVQPNGPQFPVCLFVGPSGWSPGAGTYRVTLTATRSVLPQPLAGSMLVTFSSSDIQQLSQGRGNVFLRFATQPGQ
jgi:hypothetical protein